MHLPMWQDRKNVDSCDRRGHEYRLTPAALEVKEKPRTRPGSKAKWLLAEAKKKGWIVISMKDDWKTIFPK